jgi:AraC-like DNA-binding protein
MKIAPRPLLVLHGDRELRRRIRTAARRKFEIKEVSSWVALDDAIRDAPPSALVVVDPYASTSGDRISHWLHQLLADFPSASVFAAFEVTEARIRDLVTLGHAGVVDVIAVGHDDTPEALAIRMQLANGRPLKALLDQVLPEHLSGRVRALMDAAAETVSLGQQATELARALGHSRRTLLRWSHRVHLPPPRRLLAWMRILLAAQLLDDRGRTVLSVAMACGYSGDGGLRRVTTRFLRRSPSALRRSGAFKAAARGFLAELEKHRAASAATTRSRRTPEER